MKNSINRLLLKKFRDTCTVDRLQGSDRLRIDGTNENIDQVNDIQIQIQIQFY